MKYEYPLTAVFNDGESVLINDQYELQMLITQCGWFGYEWLETEMTRFYRYKPFTQTLPYNYESQFWKIKRFEWIVRDDFGQKVDPKLIELDWPVYLSRWFGQRVKDQQRAADQGLPIPHLRSRRPHRKHYRKNGGAGSAIRNLEFIKKFNKFKNTGSFD